ncbi:uncharacterized protein LOC106470300 [Limulus polyphemus]|uniref:Uncharacterized protein LOC106470300 n=1 Tax=Limulus polyphemus TaxID=6850 RepID=A0ABM1BPR5_LIMPO|nr:uncharacterized protein LOC106470300 [Limulus polyphemus]
MRTVSFSLWIIVVFISTFAQDDDLIANVSLSKRVPIRPIYYYYCDDCFLERTREGRAIRRCWCSFLRSYQRYMYSSRETRKYQYLSILCQCIRNAIRRYAPGVVLSSGMANLTNPGRAQQ